MCFYYWLDFGSVNRGFATFLSTVGLPCWSHYIPRLSKNQPTHPLENSTYKTVTLPSVEAGSTNRGVAFMGAIIHRYKSAWADFRYTPTAFDMRRALDMLTAWARIYTISNLSVAKIYRICRKANISSRAVCGNARHIDKFNIRICGHKCSACQEKKDRESEISLSFFLFVRLYCSIASTPFGRSL